MITGDPYSLEVPENECKYSCRRQSLASHSPSQSSEAVVSSSSIWGHTGSLISNSVSKGRGLQVPRHEHEAVQELNKSDSLHLDPPAQLEASTLYSPENMHQIIFDYLNTTFPHLENRFINGAQGGVGSSYFGWCFSE